MRVGDKKVYRYATSEDEVLGKLKELHASEITGTLRLPSGLRLSDWVEQWLALRESTLRPSTVRTYHETLRYVLDLARDQRLDKLTPLTLTKVFAQLQSKNVGACRVYLAHGYLKTSLKYAVELDILVSNPTDRVKKPKWQPTE
ncbi:MAG TPA: phage integrase SAM-like domain-containing protein, partial [Thermomicrobiaceae bacterium]|nr:phage integrase SAM-like domain-containing protein [Thermomicrobiaceae bacterium]